MHIKELELRNYRNYADFKVIISEGLNFIIGSNAVGKTNLLEAIYFLENSKSHRTNTSQDLIKWNEEFSTIKALVQRLDRAIDIEATIFRAGGKQLKVNGVINKRVHAHYKPLLAVIFTPDHLKIVKETPEHRRAYLDEILEKIKADYGYWRQQYAKILKQRNVLLKKVSIGRMKSDVIDYWDTQLIQAGIKLILARKAIIEILGRYAEISYKKIIDSDISFVLTYENQLLKNNVLNESLEERYAKELAGRRKNEIERGMTLVGPHRDDVGIFVNNIDIRVFGSQGEQRSAALALKIAELSIISDKAGELPILLLDDVLSELDQSRKKALLKQIGEDIQVIITSTNAEYLQDINELSANIIRIT